MIIGLISDTHIPERAKKLPKEIFEHFSDVDLIIHCGDVTSESVLNDLKKSVNFWLFLETWIV